MFVAVSWVWAWRFALPSSGFLRPVQMKWVTQMHLADQVLRGKQVPPHGIQCPSCGTGPWGIGERPSKGQAEGWEEDRSKHLMALWLTVVVSAPLPPNTGHPKVNNAKTKRPTPWLFAQKNKTVLQTSKR